MREFACVAALSFLAIGCATPETIPYCVDANALVPEVTAECLSDPEVEAGRARLADLIVPETESALIRVEFDETSRVRALCAERGPGSSHWTDRVRVAERRPEILALPAGPACLANTRLDFNQLGVLLAEIDEILRECSRQSPTAHRERTCMDRYQARRNEIWVFDPMYLEPLIFMRTSESSSRRTAIRACADRNVEVGRSTFDATIAEARRDTRVVDCMQTHGWKLVE